MMRYLPRILYIADEQTHVQTPPISGVAPDGVDLSPFSRVRDDHDDHAHAVVLLDVVIMDGLDVVLMDVVLMDAVLMDVVLMDPSGRRR